MFRRLIALLVLACLGLGLQACGRKIKPEESCNFVQNSKAQRVSWAEATPAVLFIDSSVPEEYYPAIQAAIEEWNKARGRQILKIGGPVQSASGPARDGANVLYWMKAWEVDRTFEQARTTVYWADDRIFEADVRVNARDFSYVIGKQPGRVDLASLLVHEFGHILGLVHIDSAGSVMAKSLASNTERRVPSNEDLNSLRCEY